jgi:hypothetical protein
VIRFFDKYIASSAPCRHKLCVQVVAKQHEEAIATKEAKISDEQEGVSNKDSGLVTITNPNDFKRSMPLFPMPPKVDINVVDLGILK